MFVTSFVLAHILFFLPVLSFAPDLTGPLDHFFLHAANWKSGSLFVRLISHQPAVFFFSEQTSHQQYFSLRTNQHQPSATSQTNRLWIREPVALDRSHMHFFTINGIDAK
jgi:hypothetical protein